MIGKRLLTVSLLLPAIVVSEAARSSPTISDKRYWPNETRMERATPAPQRGARVGDEQDGEKIPKSCTYQGGPKSGLWACR